MGWAKRVVKTISARGEVGVQASNAAQLEEHENVVPFQIVEPPNAPDPPSSNGTPPPSFGHSRPPLPNSRVSQAWYIPNSVAQRASAYMKPEEGAALRRQLAFDAMALARVLPQRASGYCLVRKETGRVSSFIRPKWHSYWGELRGGMILLFDPDTPTGGHSGLSGGDARTVQFVFSATRCITDLKNTPSYSQIKLRREDGASLLMRFAQPQEAQRWVAMLQTHTVPYLSVKLSDFESIAAIGKGASGKVFLVKDTHTEARLALKVVDKTKVFRTHLTFQHVINERLVLEMCVGCPFLIQMRYAFQTDQHLYFATDFYDGGDVFSLLQSNKGRLSERHARRLLAEVILALEWLHNRNIVYRDLKPENVVLDGEGHVRLADFGLAKVLTWPENHCTQTICGTTAYAAPEMLQSKPYGVMLDLWCLGVFMYHILTGRTPFNFRGRTMEEMEEMQRTKSIRYSSTLTLEAVSLLKMLLQNDPMRRPSLEQIKKHRFFTDVDWVRVARRESHPDGLEKFVSDQVSRQAVLPKLVSTQAHQITSADISSPSILQRIPSDSKSQALDTYLLRNINAEEWRNVSFSEDEDADTVTEFPPLTRGRPKYLETAAIAAWAWSCRRSTNGAFINPPPPPTEPNDSHEDSFQLLSPRRSLPERRYSRAAGERHEGFHETLGPRMSFQESRTSVEYTGRASLEQPSRLPRTIIRRSFRRRKTDAELRERTEDKVRFARSSTEKRGFLGRKISAHRRSLDRAPPGRTSAEFRASFHGP